MVNFLADSTAEVSIVHSRRVVAGAGLLTSVPLPRVLHIVQGDGREFLFDSELVGVRPIDWFADQGVLPADLSHASCII